MELALASVALLEEIPAAFWGVVVGSFFSVLGVWMTNRASEVRLKAQFEHEIAAKARERQIEAKKQVYLDAVAAVAAGVRSVSSLADLSKTDSELMAPHAKNDAVAQLLLVADAETVKAFAIGSAHSRTALLELYPKRIELLMKKAAVDAIEPHKAKAATEQGRLIELMRQRNLAGDTDERAWTVLNNLFEAETRNIEQLEGERVSLFKPFYAAQLQFMADCARKGAELSRSFAPAIAAIRRDLGLPVDVETLMAAMNDPQEIWIAADSVRKRFATMAGLMDSGESAT